MSRVKSASDWMIDEVFTRSYRFSSINGGSMPNRRLAYLVNSMNELLALGRFFTQFALLKLIANLHATLNMGSMTFE